MKGASTVFAVAGRRIDASDAKQRRFPPAEALSVKLEVTRLLQAQGAIAVVASAACGADLVALEAASELGVRTRIVLPFDGERFVETSVADRGAEWVGRYRAFMREAEARHDVVVLDSESGTDDDAYTRATDRILREALELARVCGARPIALAIWDGKARSTGDATKDFIDKAQRAGLESASISTLRETGGGHGRGSSPRR